MSRSSKALPTAEEIWDLDKDLRADKPHVLKAEAEPTASRKEASDKAPSIVPKK